MSPGQTHPGAAPVVSFKRVSKAYGTIRAVDELSLELRPGETVALLGPNGAAKSTSLDMLLALRKPTSGRTRMFGSDPYHAVKSGRVGAMLQSGGLMPEVTVRELVTLVAGFHPRPLPVDQTLRRAGLADLAGRRVERLSGGQAQRLRFALAMVGETDLLVLDEPTAAMDVADEGPPMAALVGRLIAAQRADPTAAQVPLAFLARLQRAFGDTSLIPGARPARAAAPGLIEPLTSRELEVLRLLAAGRSNQDIARELVITLDTVKKHVSHILGKLGSSNRTEAVTRARQLDLIS
jgi:ABC-type nitrate/sulfonate/bicarbonate transport system ATPase subunit/DNA-binding CsgD family transcriptional regulator